ncbi:MAG: NAD(P)-dependent glycerol-3-phosphate dehydrogenase [Clostridia bacterium]|nr:NAD(P)-dependent glycerol-3-phosphate dehydrogenase [Clostridia bacterium]
MAKITVLGSGGWGMAMGLSAFNYGHNVTLWSPFENEVKLLKETRTNERLLKGIFLPNEIEITSDICAAENSLLTIIAVPSFAVRDVSKRLSKVKNHGIIVNLSKGIEDGTFKRLSEVIKEENPNSDVVVLSGPSHAEEVARNIPTSLVAASESKSAAAVVQKELSSEFLRVYTGDDIIGVELGGALKNVIAICAGICDGLGLGDNSKAALITRGLSEICSLGVKMGADRKTFAGLSGIGDLIVTCTSCHSRNNRFGNLVGKGSDINSALKEVGTVEGYFACKTAYSLSKKYEVLMPITEICYGVLFDNKPINSVVKELMLRPNKAENE